MRTRKRVCVLCVLRAWAVNMSSAGEQLCPQKWQDDTIMLIFHSFPAKVSYFKLTIFLSRTKTWMFHRNSLYGVAQIRGALKLY